VSLAALLCKLKPLLAEPSKNFPEVVALLKAHSDLAEYEVARYWASRSMMPEVVAMVRSADPRQRRQAVEAIRLACTRNRASQLLRPLIKDADLRVRARARHAVNALELSDVALPDSRIKPPRRQHSRALGGWNPTGWSFGLFADQLAWRTGRSRAAATLRKSALEKYGLPELATPDSLVSWLELGSLSELRRFMRPGAGTGSPYVEFEIPKASGELRKITAPRPALRRLQRRILDQILSKPPTHEACHGFVRGRSVRSNAAPHQGAKLVLKLDLRDFFPSIHYHRVEGLFQRLGYGWEVAALLAGLTTHRAKLDDGTVVWPGVLPQGAPTSPALANLLCRRLDSRLGALAGRAGAVYTRYADDLTFSFRVPPEKGAGRFLWWVDQICQQEGFVENSAKRRVLWASTQQRVTGVVVNSGLHVPRQARHTFRAILHKCRKDGLAAHARGRRDFRAYLLGFASYVKMVQPKQGQKLLDEVRAILDRDKGRS